MFPRITDVRHIQDYRLELTFADGTRAEMDFHDKVFGRGGVFLPLQDVEFFRQVRVDPEAGTLVWPNDVDLDPDVLYSEATGTPPARACTWLMPYTFHCFIVRKGFSVSSAHCNRLSSMYC